MRLGFLGSGTIAVSVMRGISRSKLNIASIYASAAHIEAHKPLEAEIRGLKLTENSQEVIDNADIICVALPGQVCEKVLSKLQFRPGQKLISFVPSASLAALEKMTGGKAAICRAVPLPFVAEHKTATPIFPADKDAQALFGAIGGFLIAAGEQPFNLFMTAGSMMGVYYRFCGLCTAWLHENGLPQEQALLYMTRLFAALAEEAQTGQKGKDFTALQQEYSTKGGTNEMVARLMAEGGGFKALQRALDETLRAIAQ